MKRPSPLRKLANKLGWYGKDQIKALANQAARNAIVGWQAASVNRLTQSWTTQNLSVDSDLRRELPIIRARSRQIVENNDYGRAFARMLKDNVLGEYGIALKSKARDPGDGYTEGKLDRFANTAIETAWYEWGKKGQCTVDRKWSWCDLQRLILETCAKDGEIIIRKVPRFDNKFRYALQIFESDYLDVEKNEDLPDGRQIRMGIEFNTWMEPIAYHLLTRHPNDNLYTDVYRTERYIRVPASQIIHPFIPFRPHQSRGYPWTTTALYRMNMVGKYEESEAAASRAAAAKMAFLVPQVAGAEYQGEEVGAGDRSMDAEPGAIEQLPANMDIKTIDWNHPNSSYQVFMKTCLRGVAAGLGVSYNTLGNDMESVNFASGRLGLEAEREAWKAIQRWFIESVVQPIFEDWLDVQLLTAQLPLPYAKYDKFNAADWRPRRWSAVNPVDDVKAKIEEVRAGFNSITGVLAERGLDRDEIFSELADDYAMAEEKGIPLPALMEGLQDPQMQSTDTMPETPQPKEATP